MAFPPAFEPIVVTTTSDQQDVLHAIAEELVKQKLAACVQVSGPVTSYYRWQEETHRDSEWQCVIKTSRHVWEPLQQALRRRHNYDQPQLVATTICDGSADYLRWMADNLLPVGPATSGESVDG